MNYTIPKFGKLWDPQITFLPNGWGVAIATIGPDLARAMLATIPESQRRLSPGTATKYASDIEAGEWTLTHQGIAFDVNGKLHDGQHRLTAITIADAPASLLVFFGAGHQKEMSVLDTHRPRTAHDAARVVGANMTRDAITLTNALMQWATPDGPGRRHALTHTQIVAAATRHADALDAVAKWYGQAGTARGLSGLGRASIRAAVAAAYYYVPHDVLARFVGVMLDDIPATEPGDAAAKLLRHHVQGVVIGNGGTAQHDLYLRTCRAIQYAVDGVATRKLYAASSNPYPIAAPDAP